jgi:hypothetical protein
MADSDDGFVGRWSRLKRRERSRETVPAPGDAEAPPAPVAEETAAPAERATTEIVEPLPDIDSLDEGSDFTVFLREGVPEELRKRALRRLWRLNPVFANLDGLNDYDEDFAAEALLGGVKTLYQVGKGMIMPDEPAGTEAAEAEPEAGGGEPAGTDEDPALAAGGDEEAGTARAEQVEAATPAPAADADPAGRPAVESRAAQSPAAPVRLSTERRAARRRWGRFEG